MYALNIINNSGGEMAVTLTEAKAHLRVDHSVDDTLITRLIEAATEQAQSYTGRQFRLADITLHLQKFPKGRQPIYLPRPTATDVSAFDYYNSAGTNTDYSGSLLFDFDQHSVSYIEPARNTFWPSSLDSQRIFPIQIVYQTGYSAATSIPPLVKQAILLQVGAMYEYREGTSEKNITHIANGFYDLLQPYIVGDEFQQYGERVNLPEEYSR